MTDTVHLHIGEPKSGTTYIQETLQANVDTLRDRGVLFPRQRDQVRAAQSTIRNKGDRAKWLELASSVLAWEGSGAVISMETLCRADEAAIQPTVGAFGTANVHVVITSRDLIRTLPAQWQQSTQHRKAWSWKEYCSSVVEGRKDPASRNFWSQHDVQRMVRDWASVVPTERITVVTLPQRGGDQNELWKRFALAVDIDADGLEIVQPANESLGSTSAELLRRVNLALEDSDITDREYNTVVRNQVARKVLGPRRSRESRVQVPAAAAEWAQNEAERIIDAITDAGVRVVGNLADLRPNTTDLVDGSAEPVDEEVTEAAVDAIRGMVELLASHKRARSAD